MTRDEAERRGWCFVNRDTMASNHALSVVSLRPENVLAGVNALTHYPAAVQFIKSLRTPEAEEFLRGISEL